MDLCQEGRELLSRININKKYLLKIADREHNYLLYNLLFLVTSKSLSGFQSVNYIEITG